MTILTSINKLRKTSSKGKGKAKVIPQERRDFRSDRYNNNWPQKDFLGNLVLLLLRWSAWCFRSQCIESWKGLKMSHTLNGQIRWEETL